MDAPRPRLRLKPEAATRDPQRRPLRALTAPRRPPAAAGGPGPAPAAFQPAPATPQAPPASEPPTGVRISKLLADRGLASRREADEWIAAGLVRIDGQVAVLGQRAAADAVIDIDARAREGQAQRVTVLLHKPLGVVSGQAEDGHQPAATLITAQRHWSGDTSPLRFHPGQLRGLAPAGRLDLDSSGLLVLTQDGRVAKLLIGDQTRVEKEYLVRVRPSGPQPLAATDLERLRHGLVLDGHVLRPARVSWASDDQLRFVLREGRKRQIRRMCEQVGLQVVELKRLRIGRVALGALPPGQWRYLGEHERFA